MAKVTILIPTYNRESFILEALDSAASQTFKDIEILVTDNCSTDKTQEIVRNYPDQRVRLQVNEKNLGPLLNWKRGIEQAKGELIKILWSDDLIDQDYLEKTIPLLTEDLGFVFSKILIGKNRDNAFEYKVDLKEGKTLSQKFISNSLVGAGVPSSPGCALFRKEDLKLSLTEVNSLFDQDRFKQNGAGPDLLFFLKTCSRYPYFYYTKSTASFFRDHAGSITVSEKSKAMAIALDYLKAKAYFAELFGHPFLSGLIFEIRLRQKDVVPKRLFKFQFMGWLSYLFCRGKVLVLRGLPFLMRKFGIKCFCTFLSSL